MRNAILRNHLNFNAVWRNSSSGGKSREGSVMAQDEDSFLPGRFQKGLENRESTEK